MSDDLATLAEDIAFDYVDNQRVVRAVVFGPRRCRQIATSPPVELPRAVVRAPWWRRFFARVTCSVIVPRCGTCHSKLGELDGKDVCVFCEMLAKQLEDWRPRFDACEPPMSVEEAGEILTELRRQIVDRKPGLPPRLRS